MTCLPAPLTPPDCDVQDFSYMPLHVARLRDSDLAAEETPEACWYAVLLWAASWHQIPAASLPDNETVLCKLVGLGRDLKTFRKNKAGMMRGYILCSDGRWYHPVVAERANISWESKLQQRWRTECARVKKANQRNDTSIPVPEFDTFVLEYRNGLSSGTLPIVPRDIASKGEGEGEGEGDKKEDSGAGAPAAIAAEIALPVDPPNPEKVMFDAGLTLLFQAGYSEARARPVLGKWKSQHGAEAVIVALGKAQREGAVDPVGFINGCFRNGGSNGSGPGAGRRNRSAEIDDASRRLGFDG
ncbi:DUF1376 domain-containing protein [Sphingomonas sp. HMP6]|uniref:DUF1376 domain-containing protein n=1 Tax=Sphingomonas sp. HMP6 TaxID=1517551 RepID=UPI0015969FDD|nr:DUF1376 domain-containing protein [Sphingomonas sp. HMP6]BCA57713.1 hypothetical protein HMP06_0482 [Sphingomonas sp. HMP6]